MPSVWTVTLRGMAQRDMLPSPFHGMVSHWLAHDENPARFSAHYQSVGPRTVLVTIRVLDDSLEPAIPLIPLRHLQPSGFTSKDRSRIQGWTITSEPHLIARYSWADLLHVPEPVYSAWRIRLLTPTAWSKTPGHPTNVDPRRLLHSAKDHWAQLDATTGRRSCPLPPGGTFPNIRTTSPPALHHETFASLETAPDALLGHLDVTVTTEREARITQQLLNFASLAGIGVQRTWGMGAIEVTAIPPHHPRRPYTTRRHAT